MLSEINKFINLKNPLFRFFLFLLLFAGISTLDAFSGSIKTQEKILLFQNLFLCGMLGFIFYYVSRYLLKIQTVNPINVCVSSILIYLLVHPTNAPLMFILVYIGMFLGKYFIKVSNLPIFNPAAIGLFIALYFSKILFAFHLAPDTLLVSWWGADFQQQFLSQVPFLNILCAATLLLGCVYFTKAFRKTSYAATFFLTYLLCNFIFNLVISHQPAQTISIVFQSFFNSIAFLALIMIPEPKTSPALPTQQIIVGLLAGAALFLYSSIFVRFVEEPFITTILTANLFTLYIKQKRLFQ